MLEDGYPPNPHHPRVRTTSGTVARCYHIRSSRKGGLPPSCGGDLRGPELDGTTSRATPPMMSFEALKIPCKALRDRQTAFLSSPLPSIVSSTARASVDFMELFPVVRRWAARASARRSFKVLVSQAEGVQVLQRRRWGSSRRGLQSSPLPCWRDIRGGRRGSIPSTVRAYFSTLALSSLPLAEYWRVIAP